jgi:hypothetical protein
MPSKQPNLPNNTMEQLGLQFSAPKTRDTDIEELVNLLADPQRCPDWMTALQIGDALGWSDRKVRQVASDCDRVISYPGSPGYKVITRCTTEEYRHYRNAMRRQARVMIGRVLRTDRQFFGHPASVV